MNKYTCNTCEHERFCNPDDYCIGWKQKRPTVHTSTGEKIFEMPSCYDSLETVFNLTEPYESAMHLTKSNNSVVWCINDAVVCYS